MQVCSIEGCNEKHNAKGYCQFHYDSYRYYGDPLKSKRLIKGNVLNLENACRIVTNQGYVYLTKTINGKIYRIFEHIYVWELYNSVKPTGYQVHHINSVRTDNRIENLMLVTQQEHTRLHFGWEIIDNTWWKPCKSCGELLKFNSENFWISNSKSGGSRKCKKCSHQENALNWQKLQRKKEV